MIYHGSRKIFQKFDISAGCDLPDEWPGAKIKRTTHTMNIAFLFSSDHSSLGNYYGPPVMDIILSSGVSLAFFTSSRK